MECCASDHTMIFDLGFRGAEMSADLAAVKFTPSVHRQASGKLLLVERCETYFPLDRLEMLLIRAKYHLDISWLAWRMLFRVSFPGLLFNVRNWRTCLACFASRNNPLQAQESRSRGRSTLVRGGSKRVGPCSLRLFRHLTLERN